MNTHPADYLRKKAQEMLAFADEVESLGPDAVIIPWGNSIESSEVYLFHWTDNGVDQGQGIEQPGSGRPLDQLLSPLRVGESTKTDFKADGNDPVSHRVYTLLGRYRIAARLSMRDESGNRQSVAVPVEHVPHDAKAHALLAA
ncbi:hypothetical protein [Demequina flava]|uniref:hypothetical protein n=1 Tax=Demequina flava TaxID=1095025 RepID=UPI0007847ECE|nr:hypothetical protein [Demequina flava]